MITDELVGATRVDVLGDQELRVRFAVRLLRVDVRGAAEVLALVAVWTKTFLFAFCTTRTLYVDPAAMFVDSSRLAIAHSAPPNRL